MKVLFATKNPAKIKRYVEKLERRGVEILTINDIGIDLPINENGKNAIENAYIKAKAYYDETKLTTIAVDDNLYIEGLPKEKQPGTNVRRVNGKRLTDDEMIEHYTNLVKEYGGKLTAKWVFGMVIYNGETSKKCTWNKEHFYLVDRPCLKRTTGYPLDSISILPETNKYFVELTEEEKNDIKKEVKNDKIIDFIMNNI